MPRVNLAKLTKVLKKHEDERNRVLDQLTPMKDNHHDDQQQQPNGRNGGMMPYLHCGAFAVDASAVREALAAKHQHILQWLLSNHADTSAHLAEALVSNQS